MNLADKLQHTQLPADHFMAGLHPNHLPPGWREIAEEEFAKSHFFIYGFEYVDYRSVMWPEGEHQHKSNVVHGAKLFYMWDKSGYAIVRDYWGGKIRYFKFGCDHTWGAQFTPEEEEKLPRGRCIHNSKCSKCGHIQSVDSSD